MNEELSQEINSVANNEKTTKKLGGITGKGFMPGKSGNPSGRPKGTMKSYLAKKFIEMSEEEKEEFLKKYKVTGKDQIEFGEGKAKQDMGLDIEMTTKIINIEE